MYAPLTPGPQPTQREAGARYRIEHPLKGTFTGLLLRVDGAFAVVEVLAGIVPYLSGPSARRGDVVRLNVAACRWAKL
jgi:hypothetical protein